MPGSESVGDGEVKSKKLHGRAFYESIGSPKFVLAPMVDQSEFAWRMLSRSFMPESKPQSLLAYSPMLHARMFRDTAKFRDSHFQPLRNGLPEKPSVLDIKSSQLHLDGNPSYDRPLFVQFCANSPDELLEAASYVAPFCDAVDLNLGCPQGIARKGKYGAFLQEDQELIYNLINKLHVNLPVPITAKIRVLETKEKTLAYAKKVLDAGASILTVHGRKREQKGHATGLADWTILKYLREQLPSDTVLFANGNILKRSDIDRCLKETGADAVMSAEGNLYDPAIFSEPPPVGQEGREYWRGRDGKGGYRMDAVMRRYMDIIYKYVLQVPVPERKPLFLPSDPVEEPAAVEEAENEDEQPPKKKRKGGNRERSTCPNLGAMQPHCFHMLRSLVSKHHHIRDALAQCRAGDVPAFENVLQMVEIAVKGGLIEYEATDGKSIEVEEDVARPDEADVEDEHESSVRAVRECRRPWWICQSYVRPTPKEAFQKGSLALSKKDLKKIEDQKAEKKLEEARKESVEKLEGKALATVNAIGHNKSEEIGEAGEKVEVLKDGLVCG